MIIEDDLIIAENLKENLEEMGYVVTGVAHNFEQAKLLYEKYPPDLCVVDINLEGSKKDGIESVYFLTRGNIVPIILLSSYHNQETVNKASLINPAAYLIKPANQEQLYVAITMALNTYYKPLGIEVSFHEEKTDHSIFKGKDCFFAKVKNLHEKILFREIKFLKASGSSCEVYLEFKKIAISANLKSILAQLNLSNLKKCHRSYAINVDQVEAISDSSFFFLHKEKQIEIPISSSYKEDFNGFFPKIKTD